MRIGLLSGRISPGRSFQIFRRLGAAWAGLRGSAVAAVALAATLVWLAPAEASIDVLIDKRSQSMSVSIDGIPRYHWAVSTGRPGYATPSGSFGVTRLEEVYYSKKYDNAPMPNAVFFTNRGHAIHGTYETKRLGRAVSHGCVRLAPQNAATLFKLVEAEGPGNVRVTVVGNAPSSGQPRRLLPRIWPFEPGWRDDGPWEPAPMPQRRYRPLPFFGWNPWF